MVEGTSLATDVRHHAETTSNDAACLPGIPAIPLTPEPGPHILRLASAPPIGHDATMRTLCLLTFAWTAAACSGDDRELDEFAASAARRAGAFQLALRTELTQAMQQGGPAAAIVVCSQRATAIAASASAEGQRVRRIGTRVRNVGNSPSSEDQRALDQFAARAKGDDSPLRARGDDGHMRLYVPIRVGEACVTCHGDAAALAPEVRDELARRYPDDRATGYAVGDLRGAVVVESRP